MSDPEHTTADWAAWLWRWWRSQWDMRNAQPPACDICQTPGPLTLLTRQEPQPGRAVLWTDVQPLCRRCATRVEQLLNVRCGPGGRWRGMPRPVAVDALIGELASGATPLTEDGG